jgi:predicted ATPase/class 3 adenylate cyclase
VTTEQSLKLATVVIIDIVGSSALAHLLDPEAISSVIDGALADFTDVIARHRGTVLQYAGDSLLAAFGAGAVLENDAERAVRAGLELLDTGRRHALGVARRYGYTGFNVRIGVHTGEVLLGSGVDPLGSIRGHAVNVAARMEQTAPPGGMRISADTYRQISGLFTTERQPDLAVKGMREPLVTYLVTGEASRGTRVGRRAIESTRTRFVGRQAELSRLQSQFEHVCSARSLASLTIAGEAGLGKSRLLHEFDRWLKLRERPLRTLEARADPHTREQAYGLVRGLLAWHLRIANNDSMEFAKAKLSTELVPLLASSVGPDLAEANVHVLGQLVGLDFSTSPHVQGIADDIDRIRNRGFHVAAQIFRRLAELDGGPVAVYVDDLHWADDASLELLDYIIKENADVPMLILASTRPEGLSRLTNLGGGQGAHQRIDLTPLDPDRARELCDELLHRMPDAPDDLRSLITQRADGNPFYMEELVAVLADRRALGQGDRKASASETWTQGHEVPATLTGVLQARLDELPAAERGALQVASVVGVVFWDAALDALGGRHSAALPELVRRGLIVPHATSLMEGMQEYAFRHHLLQQVAYETVLKARRRELHGRTAAWLSGLAGSRTNDFLGTLAEHYGRAGENETACEMFARAAEHAAARYAHADALMFVGKAFGLLGDRIATSGATLQWRLLDVRERMLDLQGRRREQQADIEDLEKLANILDDDGRRAEVAFRRSALALRTAQFRAMEASARTAVTFASRAADPVLKLRAEHRLATALCLLGDLDQGKSLARAGLASARAHASRLMEAHFLNALCFVAWRQDDLLNGLRTAQQALQIDRELGDRVAEAETLTNVGDFYANLGANAEATACLEESLRLARLVGSRDRESYALCGLCVLALRDRDAERANQLADAALRIAVDVQDRRMEMDANCFAGNAHLAMGRHDAAQVAFRAARELAAQFRDVQAEYAAKAGLARVALARDDVATAMSFAEDILSYMAWGGQLAGREAHVIRLACYDVLLRVNDRRAVEVIAQAHGALEKIADAIDDTQLRRSFLESIPEHRAIVAAWAASRSSDSYARHAGPPSGA